MLKFRYDFAAEDLMRRSDQWSFMQKGIPAIFFFAGLHPDYHTPRDTPDKINYPKLEKIARLVYRQRSDLANRRQSPQFVKATAATSSRKIISWSKLPSESLLTDLCPSF